MRPDPIHVGALIRIELDRQQLTVTWLADQLCIQRPNCYRLLHAASLHTETLFRVSQVLQHDFFADCSAQLRQVLTNKPYTL